VDGRHPGLTAATSITLLALLAGCGSGAAQKSSSGSPPAKFASHSATQGIQGGNLVIGTTEEPDTLNPYITQLVTSDNVLSGIMEGMLDHNAKQQIVYKLATSYSVSKDGLTYTWHLRHGVKFQNGAPFTSKDIVANYKIIMNPKFGAYSTDGWDEIKKITTPDKYTVVMQTKHTFAPFVVDVGGSAISPAGEIAKGVKYFQQKFGRHPIGTGPFTFVKWSSGDSILMKRNPDYWGPKAHLNSITMKIIPNDNTEMVQLKTGEIQMTDDLAADRYAQIKGMKNVRALLVPGLSWYHIDLKNVGFLEDRRVRVALAYATPTQEIISRLMHGLAAPDPSDVTPGSWAFDPNVKLYPYDLKKAASLLTQAGFKKNSSGVFEKGGKPLTIEYWLPSGEQLNLQVAQVVTQSWKQLGVQAVTRTQDINSIWGAGGYQFNKKMTAGAYSWSNVDDPDDRFYWNSIDIPKSPTGTGGDVIEYYHKYPWQAQIDKLTNEGANTVDQTKRKQIYWKIQVLLHKEQPLIFMYAPKDIYAWPKAMTGTTPNVYSFGILSASNTWQMTK
jgi:peptide/nickel transport system substrate-binding protein